MATAPLGKCYYCERPAFRRCLYLNSAGEKDGRSRPCCHQHYSKLYRQVKTGVVGDVLHYERSEWFRFTDENCLEVARLYLDEGRSINWIVEEYSSSATSIKKALRKGKRLRKKLGIKPEPGADNGT